LATSPPPSASFVGHVTKPHMGNLCLVLLVVTDNGEDSEAATDSEDARCMLLLVLGVGFFKLPRLLKTVHFCTLVVLIVVLLM
jgi:hypothetical protein